MSEVIIGHFRQPRRRRGPDWVVFGLFGGSALIMGFAIKGFIDVVSSF